MKTGKGEGAFSRYVVKEGETLWRIARRYGTTVAVLKTLNGIHDPARVPFGIVLRIPPAEESRRDGKYLSAVKGRSGKKAFSRHLVKDGETLWRIARRYGTTVAALKTLNGIHDPTRVPYGTLLRIPSGVHGAGIPGLLKAGRAKAFSRHLVKEGETLWRIARRYRTSVGVLKTLNRIQDPTRVPWGTLIRVPSGKAHGGAGIFLLPLEKDGAKGFPHLVERGQTLWRIALNYGTTVETLLRLNAMEAPEKLRYGTLIRIPGERGTGKTERFHGMSFFNQIAFLKRWTIREGHPYLAAIVETANSFKIDPRLYTSLIWEESWFDRHAGSASGCRGLAQLNPRVHPVSENVRDNFRQSAGYFMKLYLEFLDEGFDKRSAVISALAAYNRGDTKVRGDIRSGRWDGKTIANIPYLETRQYIVRVLERCRMNYRATL